MKNLFEYYIETENIHFKYAKGKPAAENREYHDYNEFVFFINGSSSLIAKNIQQELIPGSIIIIPKEHFHQFCVKNSESYTRCILGFYDTAQAQNLINEIMDTVKILNAPNIQIISVFKQMEEIIESEISYEEKIIFIKGSLMQLLVYFKKHLSDAISDNVNLSPSVIHTLAIIDEHYKESISVKEIANRIFVSYSALTHKFKNEMHISVYQYITKKRLAEAHKLILQGKSNTYAAQNSGFRDYSCFYRLYKKYYTKADVSPSPKAKKSFNFT